VTLTRERLANLAKLGLDHVQISIQHTDPEKADWISGYPGGAPKKREVARWITELGLPLTLNVVVHRHNIDNIPAFIDYAVEIGAGRIEIANTQYYAWALKNRAALIPTREQFYKSLEIINEAKERLKGILVCRLTRSLRGAAEALHGRMGPQSDRCFANRQGHAVPRL
jgi:PqqA peptide cyclase